MTMTLTELEHLLAEDADVWNDEKIKQRVMLYQKARYSQHECGKQELEMIKQNLK